MINGRRKKKKQKTKWFAKQVHIHFLDFSLIIAFFVQHIVMQQCEKLRGVSGFGATNTLYSTFSSTRFDAHFEFAQKKA